MKEREPKSRTYNRKKLSLVFCVCVLLLIGLVVRLVRLMVFEADYYQELAEDLHQRERSIKAARGRILDRNGTVLASNRTVCTVSVVHSQIRDPEGVIEALSRGTGFAGGDGAKKGGEIQLHRAYQGKRG